MSGLQLSKGRVVTVFLSQGTVDGGPPGKQPALSVTEAAQNSAEVTVSSRAKLALPRASSRAKLARTSRRPAGTWPISTRSQRGLGAADSGLQLSKGRVVTVFLSQGRWTAPSGEAARSVSQ